MQRIICDFDLEDVSNCSFWATELNLEVEKVLSSRLEELMQLWIKEFKGFEQNGGTLIKECMVLELKQKEQRIIIEPSLSEARAFWFKELHDQMKLILGL